MRISWMLLAVVALSAPQSRAAESLTYLDTAGRYADLKAEVETRLARGDRPTSTLLGYLCLSYGRLKDYAKLFECAERLDRSIASGDTSLDLDQRVMFISPSDARPLPGAMRARAHFELGEYRSAIAAGETVLGVLTRIPETGGTSLYPTARLRIDVLEVIVISAVRLGELVVASRYEKQLREVSYGFIGGRMWGWLKNNALGQVNMAMGRYKEALDYIPDTSAPMKAVVSLVNSLGPYAYRGDSTTTLIELPRLVMRGKALAETGDLEAAREVFDGLLASPRLKDMGDLYWIVLFERARLYEVQRRADEAIALYISAVDVIELQRSSIGTEGSKIGFVGDKQELYARLIALLVVRERSAEAYDYVERSKSRALVDMLASKKDFAPKAADPDQVRTLIARLDSMDLSMPLEGTATGTTARATRDARQAMGRVSPELAALVTVNSVPIEAIRGQIGPQVSLVEYYYKGRELHVFVLDALELRVVTLDATGLDEQVLALRKVIESHQSGEWRPLARALYERVWAPVADLIRNDEVIVVAHRTLHYLPFGALENSAGRAIVERHKLRFVPSASALKYLPAVAAGRDLRPLVLGNPDLGDPAMDLPFAQREAELVAGALPASRLFVRGEASETRFKAVSGGFARIHFATHGKFQADTPLASGLYLAKDAENDGVLTVGELYSTNLNADLVTLSACETGLGKLANGDDVVGLARAFLFAGSRSIVASLWSVDDRATGELMKAFYENLATLDKTAALQQAQLKTRRAFPHPFFWAAFQLTGSGN